jgi:hypothetical protein
VTRFIERHPAWALIVILAVAVLLWLIFTIWPPGLEEAIGRKKVFLNAVFNGITLGGLYFLVASGFTLIFGLMRNVNLAHGSLYLFGGYVGYGVSAWTGSWILSFIVAFVVVALIGVLLQIVVFRRMEGQELRQTMVTIGLSIVFADLMLWAFGGDFYQIQTPKWLIGPIEIPLVTAVRSSGEAIFLQYPRVRLVIFLASVAIGIGMWLALNRTRIGRDRCASSARLCAGLCPRCRPCRDCRRRGRHFFVPVSRRGYALPARFTCCRDCRRHGLDPGRRPGRAHHRARRATRLGLHPHLCDRSDLPHHGPGPGAAAPGVAGEAVTCR